MMSAPLSRRERERHMRRQAMLEAAQAVFAEKGYAHATLEEIAQRAEFGKGTLYNYFEGGKDDLLFAIFDDLYTELRLLIETALSGPEAAFRPIRVLFEEMIEACFAFFLDRQELFIILIKEAYRLHFSDEPSKAKYFKQQGERIVQAMVPALEAAMEAGILKPLAAHAVAHMVLGNINGMQMHMILESPDRDCPSPIGQSPKEAARFLSTLLFEGLLATPVQAPSPTAFTNHE